jgi:hypothetical protein
LADRRGQERIDIDEDLERPGPVGKHLDDQRQEVGRPDARGRQRGDAQNGAPSRDRGYRGERDPDEPGVADHRERHEDRVEPPGAVIDDPDECVAVEAL